MSESAADQAYFQAIEETFIRLRGAPFLLSPADWQVARGWRREGVPLELVRRSLERFFDRRRERGAEGRVQSLRYCAPAVERDWAELRELSAPARRSTPERLGVEERLERLALSVPKGVPGAGAAERAIRTLAAHEREGPSAAPEVEACLERIEQSLLRTARRRLAPDERAELEAGVASTLARLSDRLSRSQRAGVRRALEREALRRHYALPVLSLFSPEARKRS